MLRWRKHTYINWDTMLLVWPYQRTLKETEQNAKETLMLYIYKKRYNGILSMFIKRKFIWKIKLSGNNWKYLRNLEWNENGCVMLVEYSGSCYSSIIRHMNASWFKMARQDVIDKCLKIPVKPPLYPELQFMDVIAADLTECVVRKRDKNNRYNSIKSLKGIIQTKIWNYNK